MIYLFLWIVSGVVGGMIGQTRNCAAVGVLLGVLFGPLGWLLALLNDKRDRCGECKGRVPDGAKRCLHCGTVFEIPAGYEIRRAEPRIKPPVESANVKSWEQIVATENEEPPPND